MIEFLIGQELLKKGEVPGIHLSTLNRIIGDPDVRSRIGLDRDQGRLYKRYPNVEVSKGLMRIVNDLLGRNVSFGRKLNTDDVRHKADRLRYIGGFADEELPDLETPVCSEAAD